MVELSPAGRALSREVGPVRTLPAAWSLFRHDRMSHATGVRNSPPQLCGLHRWFRRARAMNLRAMRNEDDNYEDMMTTRVKLSLLVEFFVWLLTARLPQHNA